MEQQKHIVLSKATVMQEVIDSGLYGRVIQNYASDIQDTKMDYGQLYKCLNIVVNIDFEGTGIEVKLIDEQNIISIGYKYFCDTENIQPITLLSENSLDCRFYSKVGEYHSQFVSSNRLKTNFVIEDGGGSQIKVHFDSLKTRKKFTLCILDNDKKHPKGKQGSTSAMFTKQDKDLSETVIAKVIDAHEIECILPLKMVEEILVGNNSPAQDIINFDRIKYLSDIDEKFRFYFDHKNGLSFLSSSIFFYLSLCSCFPCTTTLDTPS